MNIEILGQGFEPESKNSVGNHLIELFKSKEFESFTAIAAFASEAGVNGLAKHIVAAKENIKKFTIIVGVNQKATSKEALEKLKELSINSFIFFAPPPFPIFHPKVYLFEGNSNSILIIGSSNITRPGLFSNIEMSLKLNLNPQIAEEQKIINDLKTYFEGIFNQTDQNLQPITDSLIQNLYSVGIVPTEAELKKERNENKTVKNKDAKNVLIRLFPKRQIAKVPYEFKRNTELNEIQQSSTEYSILNVEKLLWRKPSLSKSDAQYVPDGTQPTFNLKLSQAKFKVADKVIDQKAYFRNFVFNNLNWTKTKIGNTSYEETKAIFHITILGKNLGLQELKISHDLNRVSGQGNVPTWLHWNEKLFSTFQESNISSKAFSLYATSQPDIFKITID